MECVRKKWTFPFPLIQSLSFTIFDPFASTLSLSHHQDASSVPIENPSTKGSQQKRQSVRQQHHGGRGRRQRSERRFRFHLRVAHGRRHGGQRQLRLSEPHQLIFVDAGRVAGDSRQRLLVADARHATADVLFRPQLLRQRRSRRRQRRQQPQEELGTHFQDRRLSVRVVMGGMRGDVFLIATQWRKCLKENESRCFQ